MLAIPLEYFQSNRHCCLGVHRHGTSDISGTYLHNWAMICPSGPKDIVQGAKKDHSTSYQGAIIHVFRCRWRRTWPKAKETYNDEVDAGTNVI